ncbi:hypothetical protein RAA17_26240 [Komagataeibacter rhaeticus]|nr:hypothetical protein [Komagataeibacter rhaeticus]
MNFGNKPVDGGNLLLDEGELADLKLDDSQKSKFIRRIVGSAEFIRGIQRYCLWIDDKDAHEALTIPAIAQRVEAVKKCV